MPRAKLSLPFERRKMALKSAAMKYRVHIAESRVRLENVNRELKAMRPTPPKKEEV